ncbi:hypothetical protein SEA_SCHIMMELS22_58 [Microbacterium phage Schimmels22]|nr:hypothetical protein SEA_SCHIMMELS22_58 [Microbacterium phage Schimmels22]
MNKIELSNHVKVGQRWQDLDSRNSETHGSGNRRLKKPRHREVEIISLPSLSSPGAFRIVKAPKAPHTIGKVRSFSFDKLLTHYTLASA